MRKSSYLLLIHVPSSNCVAPNVSPPTLYFASWIQQKICWGLDCSGVFIIVPSWFHFNCRILPRSRMMWLRTDPWNQHATPLVVRKTFLDLEEPGHRPARRPRTTKFWPHQLFSHFATVWLKGGREMNHKKKMRWKVIYNYEMQWDL